VDKAEELEVHIRCVDVLNRYALATNRRDVETYVSLYAPDGVWIRPGPMEMHGRDEIRAFISTVFGSGRPVRHLNGGYVVTPLGPDSAQVSSITTVYDAPATVDGKVHMKGPSYLAEYEDLMRRIGDKWLIQRRVTSVVFIASHAQPIPGIVPPAP